MTQQIDRVRARSVAGTVIDRTAASLGRRADTLVDTNDLPMAIVVQKGRAHAYFYPGFVLVVSSAGADFAIIDLTEMEISYETSRFTEEGSIPNDAQMIGKVWAKSNKNGTRDRRFKDNRELPVMRYGHVGLRSPGGMDEALMFSRDDACRAFVAAANDLQRILRSMHRGRFAGGHTSITNG
ncbi:hypothetical protein [Brevundimonas sp.]|uniref:hypothetical protein n=1 Tax=Brevundimonas sp. TaxID=1871086 RepID=UPI00262C1AB1|nr:hypothetical protein [Brevundimonas sp.]